MVTNLKVLILKISIMISILVVCEIRDLNLVFASDCETSSTSFDRAEVIRNLRSGGFTGVLNQSIHLNKVGNVKVGKSCINLFVYTYTSKQKGGSTGAIHMTKRLLVLSNNHYVGMYSIDEVPIHLDGNVLLFPGDKDEGNVIIFDDEYPPDKVFLQGEVRKRFK